MKINIKKYSSQPSILLSIITLGIGILLATKAEEVLDIIAIGLGLIIAIIGIIAISIYTRDVKDGYYSKANLIIGVLLIVVATIFIFCHNIVEDVLRYIIGGYILITGIMRLVSSITWGFKDKRAITAIIVASISIGLGIYIFVKDNAILSLVGTVMIIYSVLEIISYIFAKPEETTSIIINEETTFTKTNNSEKIEDKPKKKNKIKEAKTEKEKTKKKDK